MENAVVIAFGVVTMVLMLVGNVDETRTLRAAERRAHLDNLERWYDETY